MSATNEMTDLVLSLNARIKDQVKSFLPVGPDAVLALTQAWRVETRPSGQVLISRRYKSIDGRFLRQVLSLRKLKELEISTTDVAAAQKFVSSLNLAHNRLLEREKGREEYGRWLGDGIKEGFKNWYRPRLVKESYLDDVVQTIFSELLPFFTSKFASAEPATWFRHSTTFAEYIFTRYTSQSRLKKARSRWLVFMQFLHEDSKGLIPVWKWKKNEISDRIILKRMRRKDMNFADREAKEELAGHYVNNRDYKALLDLCDELASGMSFEGIKNPEKFVEMKPLLLLARHYGPRRRELLGLWGRSEDTVFESHLLINRQLGEEGWPTEKLLAEGYDKNHNEFPEAPLEASSGNRKKNLDPLCLPKHDKIRSISHFFCSPEICQEWIREVPKISIHAAQYRLKKMCLFLLNCWIRDLQDPRNLLIHERCLGILIE